MITAFDVDGTLINFDNTPNYDTIRQLFWFSEHHARIIVWSGGGEDYARHWVQKLGLTDIVQVVAAKNAGMALLLKPDICFDDEVVTLAKVNIKLNPRLVPVV